VLLQKYEACCASQSDSIPVFLIVMQAKRIRLICASVLHDSRDPRIHLASLWFSYERGMIRSLLRCIFDGLVDTSPNRVGTAHARNPTTINLRLAYEASIVEAKQQEATLDDLRSRSINFMSAISISVSIFIAINRHGPFFRWWLTAAGVFYLVGCYLFVTILLPQYRWRFCQDPTWLLDIHEEAMCQLDEDHFYTFAAKETIKDNEKNGTKLEMLQSRFQWGLLSFLFSIAILIGLFIFH
jgi:hypothetical protein